MSKPNPADMPGSMAILGLLGETPEMTVAEVADELGTRFAVCRFDPSTARSTLLRLERARGPRVRCTYRAPGRSRMQDRYRPTRLGAQEFNGWMSMRQTGSPALREALYGRIELCRLEDLPALICIAREERRMAIALYSQAKADLTVHLEELREHRRHGEPDPELLLLRARGVLKHVEPEYWSSRSLHFKEIAQQLEDIATAAGIAFPPQPPQ